MDKHWVIDADASDLPNLIGWCPFEVDTGTVVTGLLIMQSGYLPPHGGRFEGVFHPDGQEEVEKWCGRHADVIEQCVSARDNAEREQAAQLSGSA